MSVAVPSLVVTGLGYRFAMYLGLLQTLRTPFAPGCEIIMPPVFCVVQTADPLRIGLWIISPRTVGNRQSASTPGKWDYTCRSA